MKNYFKERYFLKDIILVAVSYYFRFSLRYSDSIEILYDRRIKIMYQIHKTSKGLSDFFGFSSLQLLICQTDCLIIFSTVLF